MQCIKPIVISDKETAGRMKVPCGRCMSCRLNFASVWSLRMMHELKFHAEACFVTLTYDEAHLPPKGSLVKRDAQDFFRSLRKLTGKKLRYFLGGEYGEHYQRPHYHCIIYNVGGGEKRTIEKAWSKGFVCVGTVTDDSCTYCAKYITEKKTGEMAKVYESRGIIPEFSLMSRRPGIGARFAETFAGEIAQRGFLLRKGNKVGVPRFYRSRVYTTEERLSLQAERQRDFSLEEVKNKLDNIRDLGYTECDRRELLSRERISNELLSKKSLFRRKL